MTYQRKTLFWIWLMMLVAYLDRFNVSVAGPTMQRALHLSPTEFGIVLSAFSLGYAATQIPGGRLADRYGARRLLIIALVSWSIFTGLTGLAWSAVSLIAIRVLFGLCEGIENGAQFKLIGDSFESRERSNANALFLTALAVGPAVAAPVSVWIVAHAGWRELFFSFAAAGAVVAILMSSFLPRPAVGPSHRDDSASAPEPRTERGIQKQLLKLLFAYLLFNIAFWGYNGWMPTYLSKVRGIDLAHLGTAAMVPYIGGLVGLIVFGRLGTAFPNRRPFFVAVCYVLAAAGLAGAYFAGTTTLSIAGLTAAAVFLYGGFGPFWAEVLDCSPTRRRGSITGMVNFGGQIGGIGAPVVVGMIVSATHLFTDAFAFMICALALAAATMASLQLASSKRAPSAVGS